MNEITKLRRMLIKAKIPFESWIEENNYEELPPRCEAEKFLRNQIMYGQYSNHGWKFDAIWQLGSYGNKEGKIEVWGDLTHSDEPLVMTAKEAFAIIKKDWDEVNKK